MSGFGVPRLEGDNGTGSSVGEPEPAAGFEIDVGGNGENKLSARASAAAAATYPSVNRSPNASSGTSIARGGSGAGGTVRAAPAAAHRRDGPGHRPTSRRRAPPGCVSRARPALSRSRLPGRVEQQLSTVAAAPPRSGRADAPPRKSAARQAARPRPRSAAPAPRPARQRRASP